MKFYKPYHINCSQSQYDYLITYLCKRLWKEGPISYPVMKNWEVENYGVVTIRDAIQELVYGEFFSKRDVFIKNIPCVVYVLPMENAWKIYAT